MHRAGTSAIYSTIFTPYPDGLYWVGPYQPFSSSVMLAVQFVPAKKAKATEIDAGISYTQGTTNAVTLTLYSDFQGNPDHPLASGVATHLGKLRTCCTLAVAKINKTKLLAGTPYWVVATVSGDTVDAWNFETADQVDPQIFSGSVDGGKTWSPQKARPGLAVQVLGQ